MPATHARGRTGWRPDLRTAAVLIAVFEAVSIAPTLLRAGSVFSELTAACSQPAGSITCRQIAQFHDMAILSVVTVAVAVAILGLAALVFASWGPARPLLGAALLVAAVVDVLNLVEVAHPAGFDVINWDFLWPELITAALPVALAVVVLVTPSQSRLAPPPPAVA